MSDSSKKSSNGTVDQIIQHMTADIQNSDGQYIQLGFTPPPTPNDAHIWSEYSQNQMPQNPFVHYGSRSLESMTYVEPNRFVAPNVQYNNFNPIFVPDLQNSGFDKHLNIDIHGNKYVLYQGQNPQYVITNQDIPLCNYMPIYPENRDCAVFPNQEIQMQQINQTSGNNEQLYMSENVILQQNTKETIKNKIMIPPAQNRTHLIENLVGNWAANTNGTYSPFGNVQSQNSSNFFERKPDMPHQMSENRNNDFASKHLKPTVKKQKQIAEVRPMRPTYSDVLTKSVPAQRQDVIIQKENKNKNIVGKKGSKTDKFSKINLNKQISNNDGKDLNSSCQKFPEKQTEQKINLSRKWVSLDDVNDVHSNTKDFLKSEIINTDTPNASKLKKQKKVDGSSSVKSDSSTKIKKTFHENGSLGCQWTENEENDENSKNEDKNINKNPNKKVKDLRANSARQSKFNDKSTEKPPNSAKRNQRIRRKDNHSSFGLIGRNFQYYVSRWSKVVFSCILWLLNLISDIFSMSLHLGRDLGTLLWDYFVIYSKAITHNTFTLLKRIKILTKIATYIDKTWGNTRWAFWNRWLGGEGPKDTPGGTEGVKSWLHSGLEHNINMPTTGEEAMKRLLACKGKDPYSILGVRPDCTDDDIKRYYKRQAFLVHPDKNPQPGAEEAFKILVHAFDIIGEPERRQSYDRKVAESHQVEQAWSELNDLLSQLHQKMEYAANTIRCTNCTKRHRRVAVDRPCYAARMCSQCKIHHSAKEGDIWAEATCWGFLWHYYACMDGSVYDITEWAGCQRRNLKHLRPNSHNVQYRIVLGKQAGAGGHQTGAQGAQGSSSQGRRKGGTATSDREVDLENFLNNLYSQADLSATSGTGNTSQHSDTGNSAARNRKKNKRKK